MNIKNIVTSFWETVSLIVLLALMVSLALFIIGVFTQAILMIVMGLPLTIFSVLIGKNIVPWFLSPAPVPLHYEFLFFMGFGLIVILLIALIICGCVLYARRKETMKKGLGIILLLMITITIPAAAWAQCGCNTVSREEAKLIGIAAAVTWSEAHARFYCSPEGTVLEMTYQDFLVNILITIAGQVEVIPRQIEKPLFAAKVSKIRNLAQEIIDQSETRRGANK